MQETEYEVDKILDKKIDEQRNILYKICWKGYTSDYDTWEPAGNLSRCKKAIEKFENSVSRASIFSKMDQFLTEKKENSVGHGKRHQLSTNADAVWQIANNLEPSEPSSSSSTSSSPAPIFCAQEKISPLTTFTNKKKRKMTEKMKFPTNFKSNSDKINQTVDEIFIKVVNGFEDASFRTPCAGVEEKNSVVVGHSTSTSKTAAAVDRPSSISSYDDEDNQQQQRTITLRTPSTSNFSNAAAIESPVDNNAAQPSSASRRSPATSETAISIVDRASIGYPNDDQSFKILLVENPFADFLNRLLEQQKNDDQKLNDIIGDIVADLSILNRLGDRLREKWSKNQQSPVQLAMRCIVENEQDANFCQNLTLSNSQNYGEFCSDLCNLDQFLTKTLTILNRSVDEKFENSNFKFRQYLLNGDFDGLENLLDGSSSSNLDVNFTYDDKNALIICCSTPCSSNRHVQCRLLSTLISKGCSVNGQDGVGETALSIAGHVCQTGILLKNKADPNLLNNMNENALFTAVRYCPEEKICAILDLLLNRGFANLYARNVYGQKIGAVVQETGRRENLFRFFDQYQTRLEQFFHRYFQQTFNMTYALSKKVQILQLRYHKLNNNKNLDYLSVQFKISEIWVPGNYAPWLFLAVAEKNDDAVDGNGTKFSPTKNFLNADVFLNGVPLKPVSTCTKDILWFNAAYGINKLDFQFKIETNEPITLAFQANVVRFNA